jgi:hypothetical protein
MEPVSMESGQWKLPRFEASCMTSFAACRYIFLPLFFHKLPALSKDIVYIGSGGCTFTITFFALITLLSVTHFL